MTKKKYIGGACTSVFGPTMYYSIHQLSQAYHKILKRSSSHSSCQLVIFVSCLSLDTMCATKILSLLFKKQLVQSQIIPVFGYAELKHHYKQLDDEITSVILIGCGGIIDIETYFDIDPEEYLLKDENEQNLDDSGVKKYKRDIYVLDSHRPWNLDNLFGSDIVQCFDDGTVEEYLTEQKDAYYKLVEIEEQEEENPSDDDNIVSLSDESSTDKDEDDDDDDLYVNKRKHDENLTDEQKKRKHNKQRKKDKHKYENILEEYYAKGTTTVNSLAAQVYSLLSAIGETNLQYLWLAIIGTTSLDTTHPQVFNRLFPLLQDEVKRLSPTLSSVKTPDSISLTVQPDYCLFLLRRTSLYDSFYYSNYVNAKLSLWNENGKKRLHKMFARMGIPLTTAQEAWLYMDNTIKRELGIIFDKNLDRYGLQDIVRDGFIRTLGYRGSISASELVEALSALLEAGNVQDLSEDHLLNNNNSTSDNNNDDNAESTNSEDRSNDVLTKSQKRWLSNFWLSWDALDDGKPELLNRGIQHAQSLQKSIFSTGVTILDKKLLKNLRIYRLCVLQEGPDLYLYKNPLTLLRLGNWLIECCAEAESNQLLPLVLASLNAEADTYLVAGLPPRYPRGLDSMQAKEPILNNFSIAFQQITAQTAAKVKIDNFDSSIIEIRRDDLSPFLEKLTLSGLL